MLNRVIKSVNHFTQKVKVNALLPERQGIPAFEYTNVFHETCLSMIKKGSIALMLFKNDCKWKKYHFCKSFFAACQTSNNLKIKVFNLPSNIDCSGKVLTKKLESSMYPLLR